MNRKLVNGLLLAALVSGGCGVFTSCKDTDDELVYGVNGLQAKLQELQEKVDQFPSTYASKDELRDAIKNCFTLAQADALEQKINAALAELQEQLTKNYVADINLNQTWNPMFGTINLPVGLSSTIAATYYGESDHDVKFPALSGADAAYDVLGAQVLTSLADITALNPDFKQFEVSSGIYMDQDADGIASLGKLYLSFNPTEVDVTKLTLSLVNSNGEPAPVESIDLKDPDKLLTFGVTRSDNGLYMTELKVKAENAEALKVNIDVEALKNAMKSAINDRTKSDLANFAKIMMDSMKELMPAYAVKATWTTDALGIQLGDYANPANATRDGEGEGEGNEGEGSGEASATGVTHNYIGKYEIAATTVQPLGYKFLEGVSTDKHLPVIGSFEEVIDKVLGQFNITIKDMKIEGKDINIYLPDGDMITLTYDPSIGEVTGNEGALNGLIDSINSSLASIKNDLENSINDVKQNIKNRLEGKLSGLNNLLSLYNSLADRVNKFLKDPNAALQVTMAYEGKDKQLHMLSANEAIPSVFSKANANAEAAIVLYPTSYTAELIAPSCKKYVAVSKIWDENGNVLPVSNEAYKNVNNPDNSLNTVISGAQQEIPVMVGDLQTGYKYEVVYSSLDYQGYTSTRTFYFTVAE